MLAWVKSTLNLSKIPTFLKDNAGLQKRIDMLENDLEEKCNHFQQVSCQNEEMSKEFADIEQNQRNEIISQGRLIDLLKGNFSF